MENSVNCPICGRLNNFEMSRVCYACGTPLFVESRRINARNKEEAFNYRYACCACGTHGLSAAKPESCPYCGEHFRNVRVLAVDSYATATANSIWR